jgi:hypothetical protein
VIGSIPIRSLTPSRSRCKKSVNPTAFLESNSRGLRFSRLLKHGLLMRSNRIFVLLYLTFQSWNIKKARNGSGPSLYAGQYDGLLPGSFVNHEYNVNGIGRDWQCGDSYRRLGIPLSNQHGLQNFRCGRRLVQRIRRLRNKSCVCVAERLLNFSYGQLTARLIRDINVFGRECSRALECQQALSNGDRIPIRARDACLLPAPSR